MAKSKPNEGDKVEMKDIFEGDWHHATVQAVLSIQFTARTVLGKRVMFGNYRDHGVTWRYAK